jgi:large subunit ribosomal protein L35
VRDGTVQRCRRIAWNHWEENIIMPKMKTNKQAARRFKITGTGKVMRAKGGKSHLRRKKSKRTRRMFDKMHEVAPQDAKRIKRLLPYGLK